MAYRDEYETRSRGGGYDRDRDRGYERSRRGSMFGAEDRERFHINDHADDEGRFRGGGRRFGRDDDRGGLPVDETSRLIASNKVEGTRVYGRNGDRLGSIYNFMVDKRSGQVEYAVMTYGGVLGMGTRYYPLPWRVLSYDTEQGGYVVDMTSRDLEDAPSFTRDEEPRFDQNYGRRVNSWYGLGR